jgi:RNA-binding protein Musashi
MTEPGDEDDLFADLYVMHDHHLFPRGFAHGSLTSRYDADESTNRTTSAVEVPKQGDSASLGPATQPPASSGIDAAPGPLAVDDPYQTSGLDHSYQNGSGSFDAGPVSDMTTPADNEPQAGTGIKEDG